MKNLQRLLILISLTACMKSTTWQAPTPAKKDVLAPTQTSTNLATGSTGRVTPPPFAQKNAAIRKIIASSEYIEALGEIELMVQEALLGDRFYDTVWKKSLYSKLEEAKKTAPKDLKSETGELLKEIRIGLELVDKPTLSRTLESIHRIKIVVR